MFTELPHDILLLVSESLSPVELASLSCTCKALNTFINEYGWSNHLYNHPRPSFALSRARAVCSARSCAKYNTLTDNAWQTNSFVARPLSKPWPNKHTPLLAISTNRLVVVAGNTLDSYTFGIPRDENSSPPVFFEASFSLLDSHQRFGDITGITLATSDGCDDTFFVAFQDGMIERIMLKAAINDAPATFIRHQAVTLFNDFSESLSSDSNILLSLSSNGSASLANFREVSTDTASSSSPPPLTWFSTIDLKARAWASHLCLSSSIPYAAFGTSNASASLSIYYLPDAQFTSDAPSVLLSTGSNAPTTSSAVYGLSHAPPSAPWGSSPQIIVAGWYDSKVRCYDLRTPSSSSFPPPSSDSGTGTVIPTINPVLSLRNPWSYEPIYSVSCGGGSGCHITAGSARHSVLSFWDIRSPRAGWSVHAPGNDPSPVYSVILESSRCFGVTECRPFVYDFGPGVTADTYPAVPRIRGDKLKPHKTVEKKGIDYYVTKYFHNRGMATNGQ